MSEHIAIDNDDITLDDIDTNMMGIRSIKLFNQLNQLIEKRDTSVLNINSPNELLPALLHHMTITIPNDLFRNTADINGELQELNNISEHIRHNFLANNLYPFTILRICELCYDPFKYYKIHELPKFVRALSKCCFVTSCWELQEDNNTEKVENDDLTDINICNNDVSLSKIPWVNQKTEKDIIPFVKEIDTIMSANFGYDDEEEEGDDMRAGNNNDDNLNEFDMSKNDKDFIVEEYYDDDGDDNPDDDEDYVEKIDDDDFAEDNEEDEVSSTDEDDERIVVIDSETINANQITPSKRSTTEIDDYEYNSIDENNSPTSVAGTPKKQKQGAFSVSSSPVVMVDSIIKNPADEKSVLISPLTDKNIDVDNEHKVSSIIERIIYENNDSPLLSKVRKG